MSLRLGKSVCTRRQGSRGTQSGHIEGQGNDGYEVDQTCVDLEVQGHS